MEASMLQASAKNHHQAQGNGKVNYQLHTPIRSSTYLKRPHISRSGARCLQDIGTTFPHISALGCQNNGYLHYMVSILQRRISSYACLLEVILIFMQYRERHRALYSHHSMQALQPIACILIQPVIFSTILGF